MQLPSERLAAFIRAHHQYTLALNGACMYAGISIHQYLLLTHLERIGQAELGPTMTELAKVMQHTTAAATGSVERIEKGGYIERTNSLDDRRVVRVGITSKGVDLLSRINSSLTGKVQEALATITSTPEFSSLPSGSTATGVNEFVERHRTRQPARTEPPEA